MTAAGIVLASALALPVPISTCFGTTSDGALRDGCALPASGTNFVTYSRLGNLLGRTWVHCAVHDVVLRAYEALAESRPRKQFVYGETGRKNGGPFAPHKTHQNGLSVDFMVPVVDKAGESVPLPTGVTNKFGYNIEFDQNGRYDDLVIDFDALAAHLLELRVAAKAAGIGIERVILDPELQPRLHSTESWRQIRDLQFSKRRAWVRHDEHFHVDFRIPCKPKGS